MKDEFIFLTKTFNSKKKGILQDNSFQELPDHYVQADVNNYTRPNNILSGNEGTGTHSIYNPKRFHRPYNKT